MHDRVSLELLSSPPQPKMSSPACITGIASFAIGSTTSCSLPHLLQHIHPSGKRCRCSATLVYSRPQPHLGFTCSELGRKCRCKNPINPRPKLVQYMFELLLINSRAAVQNEALSQAGWLVLAPITSRATDSTNELGVFLEQQRCEHGAKSRPAYTSINATLTLAMPNFKSILAHWSTWVAVCSQVVQFDAVSSRLGKTTSSSRPSMWS